MRRYSIFLVAIPVATICVALGFWQTGRLLERRARNAEVRAAMTLPPLRLEDRPIAVEASRPVTGIGRFDYQRQIVVDARVMEGRPAVIVVTPLLLDDSTAVLVERGWAFSPDARTVALDQLRESDSAKVTGWVQPAGPATTTASDSAWPKHVQRADPRAVAAAYPYRLLPYVVRRAGPVHADGMRPLPLADLGDGPHLGYAVQWFAFAGIVLIGSFLLFRKEGAVRGGRRR